MDAQNMQICLVTLGQLNKIAEQIAVAIDPSRTYWGLRFQSDNGDMCFTIEYADSDSVPCYIDLSAADFQDPQGFADRYNEAYRLREERRQRLLEQQARDSRLAAFKRLQEEFGRE